MYARVVCTPTSIHSTKRGQRPKCPLMGKDMKKRGLEIQRRGDRLGSRSILTRGDVGDPEDPALGARGQSQRARCAGLRSWSARGSQTHGDSRGAGLPGPGGRRVGVSNGQSSAKRKELGTLTGQQCKYI